MLLDPLKKLVFQSADRLNVALSPFQEFTRSLNTVDKQSLHEKALLFSSDIKNNWLFCKGQLYWSMKPNDLGDCAIWHGVALATFALLGDRGTVPALFKGSELIQNVNGDNRLSRGVDLMDGPSSVDPTRKYGQANGYRFIQQCSESTIIGHLYGLHALLTLPGYEQHLPKLEELLNNLSERIVKDDYRLLDADGTPARYGDLRPLQWPWQLGDRKPVSVAAVGALFGLAFLATKTNKYKTMYETWTERNLTDLSFPETHFLWVHPYFQDILAYMVIHMLLSTENDPAFRRPKVLKALKDALARQWKKNCEEGNPFYTYTVQLCLGGVDKRHLQKAEQILSEFNTDPRLGPTAKLPGIIRNSQMPLGANSFKWGPSWFYGGNRMARQPLPIYQRPPADFFWQRDPYELDGGTDNTYNSLDFLVGYGLGRQAGLIS